MENQAIIRMSAFLLIFLFMAMWESFSLKKVLGQPKWYRWLNNVGLVVLNSLLLPWTLPILAIGAAQVVESQQLGLFNQWNMPPIASLILSVIILDMCIYWQHRIFHKVPVLWRLHRVHHADQDIDVTTGFRFHFIEIWLSMLLKIAIIFVLGIPVMAVFIFEILLNGCAMFNHSNVNISNSIDVKLRKWIVTPDMHRVHHSIHREETDSNYGFCLSVWDRLFGSYVAQPKEGHQNLQIGISLFRQPKEQSLWRMLSQPFRKN
ncbi:sterol desaturase family protein [Vibrio gangliei]|uniref:sterol desaturase family protein n=1 Tax=Vibrio gangliei TaxID=2077090 RepID=UPI000D0192B3|nr:sterol desaturase family protein [Vibrio gangliei]